jgi:hypothetical protein
MSSIYYAVMKTGAAQKCFDNYADPAKALAQAVEYVELRANIKHLTCSNHWREHEVREIVQEDGASVFRWVKGPVTVTIEELTRDEGPYQHGKIVAKWVGGERVL